MTQHPDEMPDIDLSDVAAEPPTESVSAENSVVDDPEKGDVGGVVPPDSAQ